MAVTLQESLELLASLNGEDSAPDNVSRKRFINAAGRDILSRRRWSWQRGRTNLTLAANGTVSLPSGFDLDGFIDIREVVDGLDNDNVYQLIDEVHKDKFTAGDYVCWITGTPGSYTLNTHETDTPTLAVIYDKTWTELSAGTDSCDLPRAMPLSAGALVFLKKYDDPEVDTTVEALEYEREVEKLIAEDQRAIGPRRFLGTTEKSGYFIGNVR